MTAMTDKRVQKIKSWMNKEPGESPCKGYRYEGAMRVVHELFDEVERLRAESVSLAQVIDELVDAQIAAALELTTGD